MAFNAADDIQYDTTTEVITLGYIRSIASLFPSNIPFYQIPLPVSHIILSYINNYFTNNGLHKWKISDINLMKTIRNAKCGDKFESETFLLSNLQWKLEIYPNGCDNETEGFFVIHLRLLSLPITIETVTFCRIFRVLENMAGSSWINTLSINEYDFWSTKCPVSELIELNCKTITVSIKLNIFRVKLKNNIAPIDFKYPWNVQQNNTFKSKQQIIWKLSKNEIVLFKQSKFYKSMCSDIFNDMWSLECNPNGEGDDTDDKGYVAVYLTICTLMKQLYTVSYSIRCLETDDKLTFLYDFCSDGISYGRPGFMERKKLKDANTISFCVDIEIISTEDNNDMFSIMNPYQIAYLLVAT